MAKSLCKHCEKELVCPTCDTLLMPAVFGREGKTLGFLCPKCMREYAEQSAADEPVGDRYPHMDN